MKKCLLVFFFMLVSLTNIMSISNEEKENLMMDIQITEKSFWDNKVEGYIFLLKQDWQDSPEIKKIEQDYYPNLKQILKKHKFDGKKGDSFVLTATMDGKLIQLIFVGLGKLDGAWNNELENLRRAVGKAVKVIKNLKIENCVLDVPEEKAFGVIYAEYVKQIVISAVMADYQFLKFKSERKDDEWHGKLLLCVKDDEKRTFAESLRLGSIIGQATNFTRSLADLPANILTPELTAKKAKEMADELGIECKIFGREKAEELGMGGFLGVDEGSEKEGQFVILEYFTEKKDAPTIALVGKGVTFDSGGLSLKPSEYMTGMKFDMCGAAAVIGVIKAIAEIKPDVNVIAVAPLVENMPSGHALRQDDIISFMNGKTAEVKNTDAEGRLILADALCYAEKFYNPDVILDVATLTGACIYALGHFFTAVMTKDDQLGLKLSESGMLTGDRVWPLPMDDDFKDAIKSDVADIANIGASSYKAGTVTAAWFLSNFIEKAKWAHLDIAGTAFEVPAIEYLNSKGASGAGVRLLVDFVMNFAKK